MTGDSRASTLDYPERTLSAEQAARYAELIARRAAHEPVAYLTGHREFLGLDLLVDRRALIPRPETELLVEAALRDLAERLARAPQSPPLVADIGVGSGAIPIALAVSRSTGSGRGASRSPCTKVMRAATPSRAAFSRASASASDERSLA